MKNKLGIFLFILSFFTIDATVNYVKDKNINEEVIINVNNDIKAVYISYLEYFDNFYGGSKSINQAKIDKMVENVEEIGFNTIILHVSPFSDSIYQSELMPYSYTLTGVEGKNPGFDYLEYFIKKSHSRNIQIYAWINPYRISFSNNSSNISENNPAYKLLNTSSVCSDKNGIYYNPSSEIVKKLLLNQISEIIDKYNVDGIHFDDYFYIQKDVDKTEYEYYLKNGGNLSLKEFRLYHTNDLIARVYELIKSKNPKITFSIAPDGNINNNYLYHYADVKTWLKEDKYVDIIMPQIYYGFNNEYSPFEKVLSNWEKLVTNDKIKIVPVLAFYKIGNEDKEAGSGINEWINNNDLIVQQIKLIKDSNLQGYAMFRYDFMFNKANMNENSVNELEKLKKIE